MKNNTGIGLFLLAGAALLGYFGFQVHAWRYKAGAITIINKIDGPTSVFLAGKMPSSHHLGFVAGGLVLLLFLIVLFIRAIHKKNGKE